LAGLISQARGVFIEPRYADAFVRAVSADERSGMACR